MKSVKKEDFKGFYETYNFIIKNLWLINAVLIVGSAILHRYNWAFGFLSGSIAAHFFFFSLRRDIEKMALSSNFSPKMAFKGHLFRYFGVGIIFALSLYTKKVNLWTMIIGFFILHFLLFIVKMNSTKEGVEK